ncbi:MAG: ATP-binding cassette domain-containing protein [Pseudomonadota bacterium]
MLDIAIKKRYNANFALSIDLNLKIGKIHGLSGVSGAGKSSLLRLISGFEKPDSGKIGFQNTLWSGEKTLLVAPEKRQISYLAQTAQCLPHLTVKQNILLAKNRHNKKALLIDFQPLSIELGITHLTEHFPHQLSGGELQRVAIARAILAQPQLLLLDEPFAHLDDDNSGRLCRLLKRLQQEAKLTILIVSHEMQPLATIADTMTWLKAGEVVQHGDALSVLNRAYCRDDVLSKPKTFLACQILQSIPEQGLTLLTFGSSHLTVQHFNGDVGSIVRIQIEAQDVSIGLEKIPHFSVINQIACILVDFEKNENAHHRILILRHDEQEWHALISEYSFQQLDLRKGMKLVAFIKATGIRVLF